MTKFVVVAQKTQYDQASMEASINSKHVASLVLDTRGEAEEQIAYMSSQKVLIGPMLKPNYTYSIMEFEA